MAGQKANSTNSLNRSLERESKRAHGRWLRIANTPGFWDAVRRYQESVGIPPDGMRHAEEWMFETFEREFEEFRRRIDKERRQTNSSGKITFSSSYALAVSQIITRFRFQDADYDFIVNCLLLGPRRCFSEGMLEPNNRGRVIMYYHSPAEVDTTHVYLDVTEASLPEVIDLWPFVQHMKQLQKRPDSKRGRLPRNEARDRRWLAMAAEGKTVQKIADEWANSEPDDPESGDETIVRAAIQRYRRKVVKPEQT